MRIVIALDSFKESADAVAVAEAIARGVAAALPRAQIDICPMADGGEGTVAALVAATGGATRTVNVMGPLGEPIDAAFGLLGDCPLFPPREKGTVRFSQTAVVEMAAASGLALVPPDRRDPRRTTTYGTGQLLAAALDEPVERVIVGIGGSATTDGGAGLAQALGYAMLDNGGAPMPPGISGGLLDRVARIDAAGRLTRLDAVRIVAACDVNNPLVGPNGAAAVYGPQKGASPQAVRELDANLRYWAELIERDLGARIADLPGAGAAGGLGGGLVAFCDATLQPGVRIVIEATKLADRVRGADLVITGEGRLDGQSLAGKTAIGVARLARDLGVPAIAIVGSVGPGAEGALAEGLAGYHAIQPDDMPLAEAMARVEELLEATARRVVAERFA